MNNLVTKDVDNSYVMSLIALLTSDTHIMLLFYLYYWQVCIQSCIEATECRFYILRTTDCL